MEYCALGKSNSTSSRMDLCIDRNNCSTTHIWIKVQLRWVHSDKKYFSANYKYLCSLSYIHALLYFVIIMIIDVFATILSVVSTTTLFVFPFTSKWSLVIVYKSRPINLPSHIYCQWCSKLLAFPGYDIM